jgi:nucleotide-binding universal stress UspA family protein
MEKKVYAILVLMFFVAGISPVVLAQTNPAQTTEEPVAASTTTTTTTATSVQQVCVINDELMKEYDRIIGMLREAEDCDDKEAVDGLIEKILEIKEEITKDMERCEGQKQEQRPELVVPSEIKVTAVTVRPVYIDKCAELEEWKTKKEIYETLYALSEEELKNKGYTGGKAEIEKILKELEEGIEKIKIECEVGGGGGAAAPVHPEITGGGGGGGVSAPPVPSGGGGAGVAVTEVSSVVATVVSKPVVAVSGKEITGYYKLKIGNIMTKEANTEERIAELKELRNEIDQLIAELIKGKDEIRVEEVKKLVTEIRVSPNEIKADNVIVKTSGKKVMMKLNGNDLEIKPTQTQVVIKEGTLEIEIKAPELTIENETLKVGNSEVELTAGDVVEKIKVEPKEIREIELIEENAKAVYKIKTVESRKLLGFIPVEVEKDLTVDASEAKVVEEKASWWISLTTK